jgi:hypothetical protein
LRDDQVAQGSPENKQVRKDKQDTVHPSTSLDLSEMEHKLPDQQSQPSVVAATKKTNKEREVLDTEVNSKDLKGSEESLERISCEICGRKFLEEALVRAIS